MKILQVIHQFMPRHVAGSEVYTYHLCRELQKRHDVHLFFSDCHSSEPEYSTSEGCYDGIPFTSVVNRRRGRHFRETYSNPRIDEVFRKVLAGQKPDIVHIQHLLHLSVNLIRVAKEAGIPVVLTLHEYWLQCLADGQRLRPGNRLCRSVDVRKCAECLVRSRYVIPENPNYRRTKKLIFWGMHLLNRLAGKAGFSMPDPALREAEKRKRFIFEALSMADVLVAPSEFLRREFIAWGVAEDRIVYSDYGFRKDGFAGLEKNASPRTRFAFIGSIIPTKGVDLLVEAFNGIDDRAELTIYGDPSSHPAYYARIASRIRNPRIRFKGLHDFREIHRAYEEIDVLVVPSRWYENSPLTIHEAFMAGVPVVAADLGGMAELVRGREGGFLFPAGSAAGLRKCLEDVLRSPGGNRPAAGEDGVKDIESHAREFYSLYENLFQPGQFNSQPSGTARTKSL